MCSFLISSSKLTVPGRAAVTRSWGCLRTFTVRIQQLGSLIVGNKKQVEVDSCVVRKATEKVKSMEFSCNGVGILKDVDLYNQNSIERFSYTVEQSKSPKGISDNSLTSKMCIYYLCSSPEFTLKDSQTYENLASLKASSLPISTLYRCDEFEGSHFEPSEHRSSCPDVDGESGDSSFAG